ncbi:MAG: alpha/beta hydrolase [Nostocaceae cyanobacterium]|nr:alpha/beta hydrolase [Nostocaceae cyanobacterium]
MWKNFGSTKNYLSVLFILTLIVIVVFGQFATPSMAKVARQSRYKIHRNLVYKTGNNYQLKLDVYENKKKGIHPTVMVIHGGGWIEGSKDKQKPFFSSYINWGFSVVNIEYRLAKTALAPAAVEDCLCALRWVIRNAKKYNLDINKIVVTGFSSGGHLALTTGTMPPISGFEQQCPGTGNEPVKISAIVNWAGITDVSDVLYGNNQRYFALEWFGNKTSSREITLAQSISPINYVRYDVPPILTIHGDKDKWVPYSQATRFHEALNKVRAPNYLFTVNGAAHSKFTAAQRRQINATIKAFLTHYGVIDARS